MASYGELTPEWLRVFGRCGLQVVGVAAPGGPPVEAAIHAVAGFDVVPVAAVPAASPGAAEELDRQWQHHASAAALHGERGEFLMLPPLSGGSAIGWVKVRDLVGGRLPSRVGKVTGSPEFLAVSVDGRRLCATSVEEDEYWVVLHEFS
ncbi:hypothetical protein AB0L35_05140 [Streptomyces sp. NPDC052309]|uniref:hypothetical protein n=1 Tax=Streptomyces sp. NPDC052309 TaxID=3155421 RepID=UPI0034139EAA